MRKREREEEESGVGRREAEGEHIRRAPFLLALSRETIPRENDVASLLVQPQERGREERREGMRGPSKRDTRARAGKVVRVGAAGGEEERREETNTLWLRGALMEAAPTKGPCALERAPWLRGTLTEAAHAKGRRARGTVWYPKKGTVQSRGKRMEERRSQGEKRALRTCEGGSIVEKGGGRDGARRRREEDESGAVEEPLSSARASPSSGAAWSNSKEKIAGAKTIVREAAGRCPSKRTNGGSASAAGGSGEQPLSSLSSARASPSSLVRRQLRKRLRANALAKG